MRKKAIMLQNDHIAMMKQIERLLMDAFSAKNEHTEPEEHKDCGQQKEAKAELIASVKGEKENIIASMKAFISNAKSEYPAEEQEQEEEDAAELTPMYVIDKIFENSPSHTAGLRTGDRILKFGSMTESNHSAQLRQDIVRQSVGKEIPVIIQRNPEGICSLKLVPRKWDGKGLLGCHLTPF